MKGDYPSASERVVPLTVHNGQLLQRPAFRVHGFSSGTLILEDGTHFGMVTGGSVRLETSCGDIVLHPHMYFVQPGGGRLSGTGTALVITCPAYRGLRQVGGPLESSGRLQYIDGCTDTLLVSPPKKGDPCLNHLHIPGHTRQSLHTHSADRVGVISSGSGSCWTPVARIPLSPGMGWWIPAGVQHCFVTESQALDVIAWHPESDFGPTDAVHPMINLTDLVSAPSSGDCSLRQVEKSDLPLFFEHQADPMACQLAAFPARPAPTFYAHWEAILENPALIARTILYRGQVVGNMLCFTSDGREMVGYWIDRSYWGRGIASASLRLFLEEVDHRPLFAIVARHNRGSIRVLEKAGFCGIPPLDNISPPPCEGVEDLHFVLA